jgi:hypothetical protein
MVWTRHAQEIEGRAGSTYAVVNGFAYCLVPEEGGGLVVIDLDDNVARLVKPTGEHPATGLVGSGMVAVEGDLWLLGGHNPDGFTRVYACNTRRMKWFVFRVFPDGDTVTPEDGRLDSRDRFMIPTSSMAAVAYIQRERKVISVLGKPMSSPPAIDVFDCGEAFSIVHLQRDLLALLVKCAGSL